MSAAGDERLRLRALIRVERPSQKAIVIGRGGRVLRNAGTAARRELEALLGVPVYLETRVKVEPNWSRRPAALDRLGIARHDDAPHRVPSHHMVEELDSPIADLQNAKVHVSIMGDEKEQKLAMHGLRHAAGFIQSKLAKRLQSLFFGDVLAVNQQLMHADGAVCFTTSAKQAAKREMQLDRLRIDTHRLDELVDSLVGLLVQQEVEAIQIGPGQGSGFVNDLPDVDTGCEPAQRKEERQRKQPPEFNFHGCQRVSGA